MVIIQAPPPNPSPHVILIAERMIQMKRENIMTLDFSGMLSDCTRSDRRVRLCACVCFHAFFVCVIDKWIPGEFPVDFLGMDIGQNDPDRCQISFPYNQTKHPPPHRCTHLSAHTVYLILHFCLLFLGCPNGFIVCSTFQVFKDMREYVTKMCFFVCVNACLFVQYVQTKCKIC